MTGAIPIEKTVSMADEASSVARDMLGVIRAETSVSSVSSIGSYSFTDQPWPYGTSSRSRQKRRPQLSESEDGESIVRSLEHRNTLPSRGHGQHRPVESVMRSLSVPPSKISTLPKHDKEPLHFWGLAFPLDSSVLQPSDKRLECLVRDDTEQGGRSNVMMPLQLSVLYTNYCRLFRGI